MPIQLAEIDLCAKVSLALSGEALSLWLHGTTSIRDVKILAREKFGKQCPLWHMQIMCGTIQCDETCEIADYDVGEGFQLLVLNPVFQDYDVIYGGDLIFQGNGVTLGNAFITVFFWLGERVDGSTM